MWLHNLDSEDQKEGMRLFTVSRNRLLIVLAIGMVSLSLRASSGFVQAAVLPIPGADFVLAQHELLDTTGAPVKNATLRVEVVPTGAAFEHWGAHPWPLAGIGITDSTGHMRVALAVPTASTLRSPEGIVNYMVYLVPSLGNVVPIWTFTRYYGNNADRAKEFLTLATQQPHIQLKAPQMQQWHQESVTPLSGGCLWFWMQKSTADAWTTVGEFHTAPWASSSDFGYGATADSNISMAFGYNRTNWSLSGTVNISSNSGFRDQLNYANQWFGYQILGLFHYGLSDLVGTCTGDTHNNIVLGISWDGALKLGNYVGNWDNHPNGYTVKYPSGADFSRTTGSAYSYSGAVTVFGASLNAESGYSTTVDESWSAGSQPGYLYGNNDFPSRSTIVYASSYCPSPDTVCL